jgi:glycosyltransferase involved in cell wall biosynthesis
VLFLINDLGMGGAERVLVGYVNRLRRVRPTVVLLRPTVDLADELAPEVALETLGGSLPADARSATALGRGAPRGQPRGRMLLETPELMLQVIKLLRLARANRSPVISTYLNRAHTIAMLAKRLDRRLRVVINVHETLSDHLEIHFAPGERRVMRGFIRRAFPRADRIVTVSRGVRDDLESNFGVDPRSVLVLHNPIDVSRIRAAASEPVATDERPLIVGVGRLVRLKGFDVLIRALARLPAGLEARLVILGEGEARPELESLVAELGLRDRVELPGATRNPWRWMSRARVVAVPSRSEAFPTVIGEALALSSPVVAARCSSGVAEYLEEGRSGVLVPPDDVDALAAALARVISDAALRVRLAEEGRRRVQAFDFPATVERYERLLLDVHAGSPLSATATPTPSGR